MIANGRSTIAGVVEALSAVAWSADAGLELVWTSGLAASETSVEFVGRSLAAMLATFEESDALLEAHRRALLGEYVPFGTALRGESYYGFVQPCRDEPGAVVGVLAIAFASGRTARVRNAHDLFSVAQAAAHFGFWTYDLEMRETTWSDGIFAICGVAPGSLAPSPDVMRRFVHPEDLLALEAAIDVARECRRPFFMDTRIVLDDGSERWVQHRGRFVYDGERALRGIGTIVDITMRKRAEEELYRQAFFDEVTRLPNRKRLSELLNAAILAAEDGGHRVAVMSVDLDRFHAINSTLGYDVGDRFLRMVAERLTETVRATDVVARVGGDEFVIVMTDVTSVGEAGSIAERVVAAFSHAIAVDSRDLYSTASVGISLFPEDGTSPEELIRIADAALARAKTFGPGTYRFYAPAVHERAIDRLELENALRRAYERSEFVLHYQAIFDRERIPVAAEALLRWDHPELGLLLPDRFIPLCEEIGLIVPLGRWVIGNAVAQLARWRERGVTPLRLALNLSGRQFLDPHLCSTLQSVLAENDVPPGEVELEITESVVMSDVPSASRFIANLKAIGVRISLDDFGTGYNSLSNLKYFGVDALKIDRTFVVDLPRDRGDAAIVSAVVALGHAMGLSVLAEGVETPGQAEMVRRLGCDEMQGFHFAVPMDADDFEALFRKSRPPDPIG